MSIQPPNGILDITGATLRVSKMEFSNVTGFDTVLNNVARNTVLHVDTTEYTANVAYAVKPPNMFMAQFDLELAAGGTGLPCNFNYYNDSNLGTSFNGYNLSFNDTSIILTYDGGSALHTATLSSSLNNGVYRKVKVLFDRDTTLVSINGENVFRFKDTLRPRTYDTGTTGYIRWWHNSPVARKIKNLKVSNGEKWAQEYDSGGLSSNISYTHGLVGVGTSVPEYTLDVAGDIRATGNLIVNGSNTLINTTSLAIEDNVIECGKGNSSAAKDLGFLMVRNDGSSTTNSNVAMFWDESTDALTFGFSDSGPTATTLTPNTTKTLKSYFVGNLGVGTASPSADLQVAGSSATNYYDGQLNIKYSEVGTSSNIAQINFEGSDGTTNRGFGFIRVKKSSNVSGNHDATMSFGVRQNGGVMADDMTILHNGNVGIGTASPATPFNINKLTATVNPKAHTTTEFIRLRGDKVIGQTYAISGGIKLGGDTGGTATADGRIEFYANDGADPGNSYGDVPDNFIMCMRGDGNVGIGTNNPVGKFDVWDGASNGSNIQQNAFIYLRNPANAATNYGAVIVFENTNGASGGRHSLGRIAALRENNAGNYSSYLQFSPTANSTEFEGMRITSAGNVGIGTNNPIARLHVASNGPTYTGISGNDRFRIEELVTNGNKFGLQMGIDWGTGHSALQTYALSSGGTYSQSYSLLLQPHGGNVGVGTNNPNAKFHVDGGDIAFEYGHGLKVATSNGSMSAWTSGTHNLIFTDWSSNSGAGDVVRFYTPGSQSSTIKLILTSQGNVGISTETMIDHRNYGGLHLANSKGISFAASTNSGSRHWRIRTDDYSDHGSLQIGCSGSNNTPPDAAGEAVMTLNRSRHVGIGNAFPIVRLDVWSGLRIHQAGGTINWYSGAVSMSVNGYNGLMFTQNSDNLQSGGTSTYWMVGRVPNNTNLHFCGGGKHSCYMAMNTANASLNFTGQHRTFIKDVPFTEAGDLEGLIVSANQNKYIKMSGGIEAGSNAITMNESLPVVSISTKSKDKKCFGVISASEDPETREDQYGSLVTVFDKESGDTRVYINSVGEGAVWVTNINGDLESGDYITTSNVSGYGMKQDSEFLANYTVAKITMDCDFSPVTQPVQRIVKELSNVNYWIGTTYSNVALEEYSNLTEENRRTVTDNETVTYQKIERHESIVYQEGWPLEVREELVNVLDEHGQLQWEDHPTETEKAYKIRYLDADGKITTEANKVYTAAFVGCTYHCG